ncbi:hypothetical protein RhiirC2_846829 [Rhizophagus irregularis]|uniref:G-protein coupled receptors family 1 profile domain-containing protein n=1 Tax=Rhizophagus irregularis TaxID=588596 RepID=A0A2N1NKT1_9GLOM|nr:hypothetical protein RhiirC2_846829 [Rhizophagus irregularis]
MNMNFIQIQAFAGFWTAAILMICFHNMIISIALYKIRKVYASSILKIIFNFGQIMRSFGTLGLYMTPKLPTLIQCTAFVHFSITGTTITRLSLAAFLLWRIRQIEMSGKDCDKWICILLFLIRTAFTIPYLILQKSTFVDIPESGTVICDYDTSANSLYGIGGIIVDFVIDIYVTARLIFILKRANKNASQLSLKRNKISLFSAVMYWNFLRLIVSFIFHILAILDIFYILEEGTSLITRGIVTILLSYLITIDAEIVHAIEGTGRQFGLSSKFTQSDHKLSNLSSNDQTYSQIIDDDRIVVVSMKRLSFLEWASTTIVDEDDENYKNDEKNDNDENDENAKDKNNDRKINDTSTETSNMEIIIH